MNDKLTDEVKAAVKKEILNLLKAKGLPCTEAVTDGVTFLLKVVSCAHQMKGMKEVK
jgi:hypothetical protein